MWCLHVVGRLVGDDTTWFGMRLLQNVMEDPVTTPEGVSFERSVIEDYLATHGLCPATGNPLTTSQLKTNKELRKEISLFQFRRLMLSSKAFGSKPLLA